MRIGELGYQVHAFGTVEKTSAGFGTSLLGPRFAAKQLTKCAMPYGVFGVRAAVYVLSAFLTMFMNNSATVAPRQKVSHITNSVANGLNMVELIA